LCKILAGQAGQVGWKAYNQSDWLLLRGLAAREEVAPLIYWIFSGQGWPLAAPPVLRDQLRLAYTRNYRRNKLLFAELDAVLHALNRVEIPVVVLKGAALALTIYEDIGLRPMCDIDLLLPEAKCLQAVNALETLGYEQEDIADVGWELRERLDHHRVMCSETAVAPVELHWRLLGGPGFKYAASPDWFWQQAQSWKREGGELRVLSPAANLLYLSAHTMLQHGGGQAKLRDLYDVKRLLDVQEDELDWNAACEQAARLGWTSVLSCMLEQVEHRLDVRRPEGFNARVNQSASLDRLVSLKQVPLDTRAAQEWKKLASLDWPTRLGLLGLLLLPNPAYMRQRYHPDPEWTWPFFYFYRWVDIIGDLIITILKKYQNQ
jgi:hypothetical protein